MLVQTNKNIYAVTVAVAEYPMIRRVKKNGAGSYSLLRRLLPACDQLTQNAVVSLTIIPHNANNCQRWHFWLISIKSLIDFHSIKTRLSFDDVFIWRSTTFDNIRKLSIRRLPREANAVILNFKRSVSTATLEQVHKLTLTGANSWRSFLGAVGTS